MQTVLVYKTSFLQKVMDHVIRGYSDFTCGFVDARSAAAFAAKFERFYAVGLDRNRRARARMIGQACAVLLMHDLNGAGQLFWVLLVTPGADNPARQLEVLRSALGPSRVTVGAYELVRTTAPASSVPVWTWRLTTASYEALRASVVDVIRRGSDRDVRQLIVSLYRTPGFRGSRVQVGKCCALFRAEWKRVRSGPLPSFPRKLFYVSRIKAVSVPLSSWLSEQAPKALAATKVTVK